MLPLGLKILVKKIVNKSKATNKYLNLSSWGNPIPYKRIENVSNSITNK